MVVNIKDKAWKTQSREPVPQTIETERIDDNITGEEDGSEPCVTKALIFLRPFQKFRPDLETPECGNLSKKIKLSKMTGL